MGVQKRDSEYNLGGGDMRDSFPMVVTSKVAGSTDRSKPGRG